MVTPVDKNARARAVAPRDIATKVRQICEEKIFLFFSLPVRSFVRSLFSHSHALWVVSRRAAAATDRNRRRPLPAGRCIGVGDASGMLNTDMAQSEFAQYSNRTVASSS